MRSAPSGGATGPRILDSGDQAVVVEFGTRIDPEINDRVYRLADMLASLAPSWLVEIVPAYRSLLVQYDPSAVSNEEVRLVLDQLATPESSASHHGVHRVRKIYELPVAYGGDNGPDLERVAEQAGMSPGEVVNIHSSAPYRVYMIGFAPGFPYLGGMDERIACPRLSTPRTRVPAGSVGIAESQTGVYPDASPGGWNLIGRTPVKLFDRDNDPPSLLQPGHFVRFVPVDEVELSRIEEQVGRGTYEVSISELDE